MLAKVITTGKTYKVLQLIDDPEHSNSFVELLEVESYNERTNPYGSVKFSLDNVELINDSDMPSENRMRYELSKAAMQGILSNLCGNIIREEIVKVAIKCADEMIKQLKESEVTND